MGHELIGTTLGQYEIRELLDDSGLTLKFRAYQPSLKRLVTLQTLSTDMLKRESIHLRKGMARGAEIMAALEHANIVPIIDYGEVQGRPYMVIRSMHGGSLRRRLYKGPDAHWFPFNEAANAVRQIGSALDYVHAQGFVHGDPSARNIEFDLSGNAYISEFLFIGMTEEASKVIRGSRRYIAPERWQQESPTPASDQYALAAVAYNMIAGQAPFGDDKREILRERHLNEMPPLPQTFRPEIPLGVNDVLLRGMAKNPNDRYPTVFDFAREFDKALNAAPSHVFISYSRRDSDYAKRLREHLTQSSFNVWIDDAIEHGDQWFNQIHEAIKTCAAFLVLMTPEAEASEWVQKEILLAKRYKKPIFPLLLKSEEFAILIDLQFADVRDGELPGQEFHRRLSRAIYGST